MSKVFLSYEREDSARAKSVALALEKVGHSVWWDRHIKGGAQYSKEIENALRNAEAVVVLWSKRSIESAWVRDEAAAGRDSGRLIPISLDKTEPPLGFRQYQTIDLSGWRGRGKASEIQTLLGAIESLSIKANEYKDAVETTRSGPAEPNARSSRWRVVSVTGSIVVAVLAVLLFWLLPWGSKPSVPIVKISSADSSASSQAFARDLLVKLGRIEATRSSLMTLIGNRQGGASPDLILEVGASNVDKQANAGLVLTDGKHRGLLWSKDFQHTLASKADLEQQVSLTAARVLACALEGAGTPGKPLKPETRKLYLNACAQISEIGLDGPQQVIPALVQVVGDAPSFKPGWAKLLMAEAEAEGIRSGDGKADAQARSLLRQYIRAARRLDPQMPETLLAEIALLPADDFAQAEKIADHAKKLDPDNPIVLNIRSSLLMAVGRMQEGIEDAQRAAELDPLSPLMHSSYVMALAYSGRIEAAREELRRGEGLWRGTDTLRAAQYAFHLRFGDPQQALNLEGSVPEGLKLFLEARTNRTPESVNRLIAYGNTRPGVASRRGRGAAYLSFIIQGYGEFQRHDDLFRGVMTWPRTMDLSQTSDLLFRPALKPFRRDPRFLQVAKRAGLIDYWQKSGNWPDFCFEPDLPYNCKNEAAKLSK